MYSHPLAGTEDVHAVIRGRVIGEREGGEREDQSVSLGKRKGCLGEQAGGKFVIIFAKQVTRTSWV